MSIELTFNSAVKDEDTIEACKMFWAVNDKDFEYKAADIADLLGVKSNNITKHVNELCDAFDTAITCCECDCHPIITSRTSYTQSRKYVGSDNYVCGDCVRDAREAEAEQERLQQANTDALKRQAMIDHREEFDEYEVAYPEDIVATKNIIRLCALNVFAGSEDLSLINPIASVNDGTLLTPGGHGDQDLVVTLYRDNVTCIHPQSNPNAITLAEKGFRFSPTHVGWDILVDTAAITKPNFIIKLEEFIKGDEFLSFDPHALYVMAYEISYQECEAYLKYCLNEHHLSFEPGDKTKKVIMDCLEEYSVAQIYSFIWRAAKDAAAFRTRKGVNKKHAANTVVRNIQRSFENALAKGWAVDGFNRNYNLPQSCLSRVFFNWIFGTADGGFDSVIGELLESQGIQKPVKNAASDDANFPF